MIELPKEQVENAAKAIHQVSYRGDSWTEAANVTKNICREYALAAAPFLQSQWEPPSADELIPFQGKFAALREFISNRNALLFPAPTRQQKMAAIIRQIKDPDRAAEQIVMLDECGE